MADKTELVQNELKMIKYRPSVAAIQNLKYGTFTKLYTALNTRHDAI